MAIPSKRVAIYPGTFDPLTNGHANIVRRGLHMFDKVIVAVAADTGKSPLFSLEERVNMAETVFAREPDIIVEPFAGLLVDYVARRKVRTILRGLRFRVRIPDLIAQSQAAARYRDPVFDFRLQVAVYQFDSRQNSGQPWRGSEGACSRICHALLAKAFRHALHPA